MLTLIDYTREGEEEKGRDALVSGQANEDERLRNSYCGPRSMRTTAGTKGRCEGRHVHRQRRDDAERIGEKGKEGKQRQKQQLRTEKERERRKETGRRQQTATTVTSEGEGAR